MIGGFIIKGILTWGIDELYITSSRTQKQINTYVVEMCKNDMYDTRAIGH
ncbi:hypothetical protein KAU55_07490 [Candidatus Bathyarchaeota archaeon]|nr:hypothetical protein [Candidatus Bathyarchaeota archaeon]